MRPTWITKKLERVLARRSSRNRLTSAALRTQCFKSPSDLCRGVVDVEIRKRSARVQVLQNRLNGMLALSAARALESRLTANDSILQRIKELQSVVAERVISAEVLRRS